jgi:hypothetical protein
MNKPTLTLTLSREHYIQQRMAAQANLRAWLTEFEKRPHLTSAEMVARYANKIMQLQRLIDGN